MPLQSSSHDLLHNQSFHSSGSCSCGSPFLQVFHKRIMADLTRRQMLGGMASVMAMFSGVAATLTHSGDHPSQKKPILLINAKLFDGYSGTLNEGVSVRVNDGKIDAVLSTGQDAGDVNIIDCGGRVLMPGLIDAHWHTTLAAITQMDAMTADTGYVHLVAAQEAERTLMRGVTTVRDVGGPSFALKRAIDEGIVQGPRIFPAGAMISQTSGHGDFRLRHDVPRGTNAPLTEIERQGVAMIADGEAEVLRRTREQLMLGATQIKLMAGGGVASIYDPLDSTQFTEREIRAAVEAAEDWGTYVMVHVYTSRGIQRALKAGVKSIEHGQLADEEAVRMMADHDAWWSLQPFLQDEDSNVYPDAARRESQRQVAVGTVKAYEMAQKYSVKTAWGTDILFNPKNTPNQLNHLAKLTRFYDPLTALAMATGQNGELLALSGPRNPYPGVLGKIEPGAHADLLVVDGDPSVSLDFLRDPDQNIRMIMKAGRIYKDTR